MLLHLTFIPLLLTQSSFSINVSTLSTKNISIIYPQLASFFIQSFKHLSKFNNYPLAQFNLKTLRFKITSVNASPYRKVLK